MRILKFSIWESSNDGLQEDSHGVCWSAISCCSCSSVGYFWGGAYVNALAWSRSWSSIYVLLSNGLESLCLSTWFWDCLSAWLLADVFIDLHASGNFEMSSVLAWMHGDSILSGACAAFFLSNCYWCCVWDLSDGLARCDLRLLLALVHWSAWCSRSFFRCLEWFAFAEVKGRGGYIEAWAGALWVRCSH